MSEQEQSYAQKLVDLESELSSLRAEVERLRTTNRELNRRNQSLEHSLALETGKKAWYGYFKAALQLFGEREDELIKLKEKFGGTL